MLCIINPYTDPYFNLAAEEYMLHNFSENCFMLWRNENAIVVGKHQNTLSEINMDYIRRRKIRVVRRLSGGGAVFHDLGNLNFTFIMNGQEGQLVDFRKYTLPILEVLQKLSVNAGYGNRNDLVINGKKFSGNAEHIYRKRVLHHGTLLFSSAKEDLSLALKINPLKYKSKAVKSIRSRVTNITEHLNAGLDVIQFRDIIMDHILDNFPESRKYEFSNDDIAKINELGKAKYRTWEWNFGYSPGYEFERSFLINGRLVQLNLSVSGGIIQKAGIQGDFINQPGLRELENLLVGVKHDETELLNKLESGSISRYLQNISAAELIKKMF
jgi:lipoate---protein ligase